MSLVDIAKHIVQIKTKSEENVFLKCANEHSLLVAVVIKGLMIWGLICHRNIPLWYVMTMLCEV